MITKRISNKTVVSFLDTGVVISNLAGMVELTPEELIDLLKLVRGEK